MLQRFGRMSYAILVFIVLLLIFLFMRSCRTTEPVQPPNVLNQAADLAKTGLLSATDAISGTVADAVASASNTLSQTIDLAKTGLVSATDAISGTVAGAVTSATGALSQTVDLAKTEIVSATEALSNTAALAENTVASATAAVSETVSLAEGAVISATEALSDTVVGAVTAATSALSQTVGLAKTGLVSATNAISGTMAGAATSATETLSRTVSLAEGTVVSATEALNETTRTVKNAIVSISESVREKVSPIGTVTINETSAITMSTIATGTGAIDAQALVSSTTLAGSAVISSCYNSVTSGDLESLDNWSIGNSPYPAQLVSEPVYSGTHSLRLGVPPDAGNVYAHSVAMQKVEIPADAEKVTLYYWEQTHGESDGSDYREMLLLNQYLELLTTIERSRAAGNEIWLQRAFDITKYRGQIVHLYFNVYNNGSGSQQWNYIDDVMLVVCKSVPVTR